MICRTTVATCNLSLPDQLGDCIDRPVFWNSSCDRCCRTGCCTLLPCFCGACGCCCRVSWRNAAAYDCSVQVNLANNLLPENLLGARCAVLLCCSPLARLQPRYDAGWGFSPSTRVQLQHLGVDSAFVFSGHSLCRGPPTHHRHLGGCLQLDQTWPKFWQL
jgi:hypothetical protein